MSNVTTRGQPTNVQTITSPAWQRCPYGCNFHAVKKSVTFVGHWRDDLVSEEAFTAHLTVAVDCIVSTVFLSAATFGDSTKSVERRYFSVDSWVSCSSLVIASTSVGQGYRGGGILRGFPQLRMICLLGLAIIYLRFSPIVNAEFVFLNVKFRA